MGLDRTTFVRPRLLLAGLLLLIGFGAYATTAAAQEDTVTVTTYVRLCLEPGCTEDLDLTENVDGVPVEVADAATGDPLGTCTTGDLEPGACAVDVPSTVTSVTIALDESAFPEGYEASDNPATLDFANATEYPFLLMPAGGFPDEEPVEEPAASPEAGDEGEQAVSALPSTGTGTDGGATGIVITAGVLTLAAAGLGVIGARRKLARD